MLNEALNKGMIKYQSAKNDSKKWLRTLTYDQAIQRVNEGVAIIKNANKIQAIYNDDSLRSHIFIRDNHTCRLCGLEGNNIRRLIPKSQNGLTSPLNCICVCDKCVIVPVSVEFFQMQNKYMFGVNNISGVVISDHALLRWSQRIDFYTVGKEPISSFIWKKLISGNINKLFSNDNWYSIDNNIYFAAIIMNEKLVIKTFIECYPHNKNQEFSYRKALCKLNIFDWQNRRRAYSHL